MRSLIFARTGIAVALMTGITCAAIPGPRENQVANLVISWNNAALQGIRASKLGAPRASRALAIVHTCIYDAWSAYDARATSTQLAGILRRPESERTEANKERAISHAAYRALIDVLPVAKAAAYDPLMQELGYDPNDRSTDIETPVGIGNVACEAVLDFRRHDKSNQLGDVPSLGSTPEEISRAQVPYGDWSAYSPVNSPSIVPPKTLATDPSHWQPLSFTDASGSVVVQRFAEAHWCFVSPFGIRSGDEFRTVVEPGPWAYGTAEFLDQANELLTISANLTDRQKMISEYWNDGPNSEQPPGHWSLFAQFVSHRDHHSLDDDVKLFFVLTNTLMDSGIAAWDAKRTYDSVRPVTAIPNLYRGRRVEAWGGPGKGTVEMDGADWRPYQLASSPTPPFPEYVSGHSTYSAAGARILSLFTSSDRFGDAVTLPVGTSKIEPGFTPRDTVKLSWSTFTEAAEQAGMSRRYGGIHFKRADVMGQKLGRAVADRDWDAAQRFFNGSAPWNR